MKYAKSVYLMPLILDSKQIRFDFINLRRKNLVLTKHLDKIYENLLTKKKHLKSKSQPKLTVIPLVGCASKGATSLSLNLGVLIPRSQATAKFLILVAPNLWIMENLSQNIKILSNFFVVFPSMKKILRSIDEKLGSESVISTFQKFFLLARSLRKNKNFFRYLITKNP